MTKRKINELDFDFESSYNPYQQHRKRSRISWICVYCDHTNNQSSTICESCKSWICNECKTINPIYEYSCTQCKTSKYNVSSSSSSSSSSTSTSILIKPMSTTPKTISQWSCTQCTLLNNNDRIKCEICNTSKPTSKPTSIQEMIPSIPTIPSNTNMNEWSCSLCTYMNHESLIYCEICQNKRQQNNNYNASIYELKSNDFDNNDKNDECDIDENIMKMAMIKLKRFGHDKFRNSQYPVIQNLIKGNNTMLILPTGGGKSLCFQIPILVLNDLCNKQQKYGVIQKGIGIIISPLISLMNDQIYKLKSVGIDCEYINSSLKKSQRDLIENRLKNNEIEMLYCAPELFTANSNNIIELIIKYRIITLFVIDEAHCISEWGHSFRPSYTKLDKIRNALNDPVTMICTATATKRVRDDILIQLKLNKNKCKIHIASFDRSNIYIKVVQMNPKYDKINNVIMNQIKLYQNERGNDPVIIYCGTQKETDKTADYLRINMGNMRNNKVGSYHAGLSNTERNNIQYSFINGDINIITATNAFGMGIDKDNVGLIIHKMCPTSIEEYYQQIGRAGRNGKNSIAVIINSNDNSFLSRFSEKMIKINNPNDNIIKTVANIICNNYEINKQQILSTSDILKKTGFGWNNNVTPPTISICIKILETYNVLKKIKSELLPLTVTFLNGNNNRNNIRENTIHWRLWNEIVYRNKNENNQIDIITLRLIQKLGINSKMLTKSLQYLKQKKLIKYQSLKRSGAIILLSKQWENMIDWNEVKINRENAIENGKKMKQLINTKGCRRKLLLNYFDQNYFVGSNPRCCDNCNHW